MTLNKTMSSTKEITEGLSFGLIFAVIKAAVDYAGGKKPTIYSAGKNTVIAAGADLIYDYGEKHKWFPWIK